MVATLSQAQTSPSRSVGNTASSANRQTDNISAEEARKSAMQMVEALMERMGPEIKGLFESMFKGGTRFASDGKTETVPSNPTPAANGQSVIALNEAKAKRDEAIKTEPASGPAKK